MLRIYFDFLAKTFQIQTSQIPRHFLFVKLMICFTSCFSRSSNNLFPNLVEKQILFSRNAKIMINRRIDFFQARNRTIKIRLTFEPDRLILICACISGIILRQFGKKKMRFPVVERLFSYYPSRIFSAKIFSPAIESTYLLRYE